MATVTLKGNPLRTVGELPKIGSSAPSFTLTADDLSEKSLSDYKGRKVALNIFPSIDTSVCAASVRRFNEIASKKPNVAVVNISADLPFAFKRFCATEGLKGVDTLSTFRDRSFGETYGVRIVDGPLAGLMSRAVVLVDEGGKVTYTEQVPEIGQEPNYDAALAKL